MNLLTYLKKEKVMTIALILAVFSVFFIPPDLEYLNYVNVRVLGLLFCLMITVKGFQNIGVFDAAAQTLFSKTKNCRALIQILIGICFFSSMLITNDVALITFVPFAILVLKKCGLEKYLIFTIVLQTIAANLGSMLTPIGNPQNLYLFGIADFSLLQFLQITAPLCSLSFILIFAPTFCIKRSPMDTPVTENRSSNKLVIFRQKEFWVYLLLFILDLVVVFRLIPWWSALLVTILFILLIKKGNLLKQVDYALLISFVGFFIFVGNVGRIPLISETIQQIISGREILISVLFSQVMSNLPTTLLLASFTDNIKALIIGSNLGGLGTLIASMASLISYKIYAKTPNSQKGKYLLVFSAFNITGLLILFLFSYFIY